jgi:Tfp pilus assembly protein PilX
MLLLMLTLLGLTSSNVAVMQERMAGNLAQSNEAFQLAESTLKAVESDIFDGICIGGGSGGFGTLPRIDDPGLGLDVNDCIMDGYAIPSNAWQLAPADVAQPGGDGWARYVIARVPFAPRCSAVGSNVLGGGNVSDESYVVLASGRAASGNSEVIVQSVYTCLL